jgi:type IV pilus assembly protein PilY1
MFMRRVLLTTIIVGSICMSAPTRTVALDTDIYFSDPTAGSTVVKPNLMLILDTSGSMNLNVSGTTQSRIDIMKASLKGILDDLANVNVGLMRFSSDPGGPVMYPVADIDATVTDTGIIQTVLEDAQDDAKQDSSGNMDLTSTTLDISSSHPYVGVRFQDVYIPQGVVVTSAKIVFQARQSDSAAASIQISADDVDNAQTFTTATSDITSAARPQTAAVSWNAAAWTANNYESTTDVSAVVQQVVNRTGWCRGNAMAFRFRSVSGQRVARAYDTYAGNGFVSAPASLVVTYDPFTAPTTSSCNRVVARVNQDTDDAEQRNNNGNMTLTGTLQLIKSGSQNQTVGIRFQNVTVPQGATITSANLEFEVDSTNSTSTSLTIKAQADDNPSTFTSANDDITSRPTTTASTSWPSVPNNAVNQKLSSPDLRTVVQEVVNRAGWSSGNAMAFIITGSGTKNVESFDSEPGAAPILRITYSSTTPEPKRVRHVLQELIAGMRTDMSTPIVDVLYEAALYYRGGNVDYGKQRGPGTDPISRFTRVSNPLSWDSSTGTVVRQAGCTDADLDAAACIDESISGSATYVSPITASCQPSHIVLLTDGDANINNSKSKVKTMTGAASCSGSGDEACGVTLANFLNTQDQSGLSDRQTVTTHTVGFGTGISASGQAFLQDLANGGGGLYKTATDAGSLVDAFKGILNEVLKSPTSFVSPSLSVNAFNKLFNRDEVYFSLFSPQLTQAWPGNVKKFVLCNDSSNTSCKFGEVLDSLGNPAIGSDAKIKTTARSFWSSSPDGPTVTLGAAGSQIPTYNATRRVYTYTGTATKDLSLAVNQVTDSNTNLTQAMLGASSSSERTEIINWMRGQDLDDENSNGVTNEDRWRFSDALHSRPATISYGGTTADPIIKLVVGTNDGGLRMTNATTGEEEWIVYLPEFLDIQKDLRVNANGSHSYGVDGTPSVLTIDNNNDGIIDPDPPENDRMYLYIGMRRGGSAIYAFDITPTTKLTSSSTVTGIHPKLMWRIDNTTTGFGALGQTWSQPLVTDIRVKCDIAACDDGVGSTKDSKIKTVLIFGAGYDTRLDTSIDNSTWASADGMGNAIFIVDPITGARIWWASASGSGADLGLANMKYAIPSDIATLDSDADGAVDRLYVGDTRGQLWRIDLGDQIDPAGSSVTARNGGSSGYVFADVGCTGGSRATDCSATTKQDRRKFFYPPDIAQVRDSDFSNTEIYDLVTIGSGDREDPIDKFTKATSVEAVHNRIYAFRDFNTKLGAPSSTPAAIADNTTDLFDATSNVLQDPSGAGYPAALADIKSKKGWFIDLQESASPNWIGEKVLARTTIFGGQLFVTTFVPPQNTGVGVCPVPSEGVAKLFSMNYLDGTAVDKTTNSRTQNLGGGIPSELVVVIREGGVSGLVGTSGGASQATVPTELPQYRTYWYQK